jgi:cytidylate kinase
MIKICLGGYTSSGKSTIGLAIAKELNIEYITKEMTNSYKDLVAGGVDPVKDRNIFSEPKYAKRFDDDIMVISKSTNCVVTTWLGPWFIKDATLKVWLNAGEETRAERTAVREKMSLQEALKFIKSKDSNNIVNFKKEYNIDITDHSIFDIEINTERFAINELASIIAAISLIKEKGKFW